MRRAIGVGTFVLVGAVLGQISARGSISASATLTPQLSGPGAYEYSLKLTNTGTTPIGTYWFSWIPGYDLLPHPPTNIGSPAGWTGTAQHEAIGIDSLQWVNTASPLQPGQSLGGFTFQSPDALSAISGTSFFAGLPVEESYVYIGAPETDPGFAFVTKTVVPEPASLSLLATVAILLLLQRKRCWPASLMSPTQRDASRALLD